ncbi:hypothetical protein CSKR_106058 [Clonorchis sinensis]|uniref:Uncharacterized protein n=1 Tax=Clonorchis sinensis TaxID=79923 RepID=A0A419Q750_CLOSI|nr:hypothetical protein CSKR_106058 [Clonorchis sinensis]
MTTVQVTETDGRGEPPGRQNKVEAGFLYGTINVRHKFTNHTNLDSRYSSKTNGPLGLESSKQAPT